MYHKTLSRPTDPVSLGQCPACVNEYSGQKTFETADIPSTLKVRKAEQTPDGAIRVLWENDVEGFSENHSTHIQPDFLLQQTKAKLRNPLPMVTAWDREAMEKRFIKIDYRDYMETSEGFDAVVEEINASGLVVITDVPEMESSVESIGEKIGPLRNSFYGRTWDVKDKPKAENVAYTSVHLGLHMDLL